MKLLRSVLVGLLSVGIIGSVLYVGSQYALYLHDMKVLSHNHIGTVFIHGKIHGQPFQWITNVDVSTALPSMSIVLGYPYSYTLKFREIKGNKAKLSFIVWQRRPLVTGQSQQSQTMVWKSVVPSMAAKLATKGSLEQAYSPISKMYYLSKNPVSAAEGKLAGDAGKRNELQATWIGATYE